MKKNKLIDIVTRQYDHKNLYKKLRTLLVLGEESDNFKQMAFTVPNKWLKKRVPKVMRNGLSIKKWLRTEYISEDSMAIFDDAVLERKVVSISFD